MESCTESEADPLWCVVLGVLTEGPAQGSDLYEHHSSAWDHYIGKSNRSNSFYSLSITMCQALG